MARLISASTLLCAFALFDNVAALPVSNSVVPEVVPGPGLPSLASLGLTSVGLYSTSPNLASRGLQKRFNAYCMTFDACNINDATACYNYLLALGTASCAVKENGVFCTAGAAAIGGSSVHGGKAASACRDVATGALWSIQNCNVNSNVQGISAAYGNGDLAVWVQGTAVD